MVNFLKRLELQGFKSFAAKTVLEFPVRVTAIVGPNGSGKSNIVDGLRWVLGERGAKELRGATLENLIFVGTAKRSAVGLAKVSLHFDNRGKELPFDFNEISLTRKIDRSGASQFFLNDAEVKLRDLTPSLARAKLGSRGLTIIGQGQSDLFVKSDPKERRMMIEEILGLREFRLKKEQAERRLESSQINMDKVKAMLEELSPHLRFLRKQKNRFDKRSEIESALESLENEYFSFHYREISTALKNLEEPLNVIFKRLKEKEKEIQILEAGLKEIDGWVSDSERVKKLREEISSLIDRRLALGKEIAKLEAQMEIGFSSRTPAHSSDELQRFLERLREEIESAFQIDDLGKLKSKLQEWFKLLSKFSKENRVAPPGDEIFKETRKHKEELRETDKKIQVLRDEEDKFSLGQYKMNQEFREKLEILEERKNELRGLEQKKQAQLFEKEKFEFKMDELKRHWQSLGYPSHKLESAASAAVSKDKIDSPEAEKKMMRWRAELAAIGEIDPALAKEAEESEERYRFLSRESEDLEKASADLKNLIKDLNERIHNDFKKAFRPINDEFNKYFRLMFSGGKAKLKIKNYELKTQEDNGTGEQGENSVTNETRELGSGVEIELTLPGKKLSDLDALSGGEKSLVSLAALFALIAVSPPPFLVLDEIDAALDEENARRFAELIKEFSKQTQFIIVTHNRATMEAADVLYGVTLGEDGVSKVLSLKLE